jgi:hypothetical protein
MAGTLGARTVVLLTRSPAGHANSRLSEADCSTLWNEILFEAFNAFYVMKSDLSGFYALEVIFIIGIS